MGCTICVSRLRKKLWRDWKCTRVPVPTRGTDCGDCGVSAQVSRKKKAARTLYCSCREASDATCIGRMRHLPVDRELWSEDSTLREIEYHDSQIFRGW